MIHATAAKTKCIDILSKSFEKMVQTQEPTQRTLNCREA